MSIQRIKQESLDFGLIGAIAFFGLNTAPAGWLKANGALVSRTTYSSLFAVIGTTYGAGDGSTTFALPDMRGEFPRGWDDGRSVDSGRVFGSAQSAAFASHTHSGVYGVNFGYSASNGVPLSTGTDGNFSPRLVKYGTSDQSLTNSEGGTETRSRNIALLACIKF
jgi:microcystin-dependent protein